MGDNDEYEPAEEVSNNADGEAVQVSSKPKKNRGKQILNAGLQITGLDKTYAAYAAAFKDEEKFDANGNPIKRKKKGVRILEATLEATGAKQVYEDAVILFKGDEAKQDSSAPSDDGKKAKKKKGKNIFKKIIQGIKLACSVGVMVCKCLVLVVGPGVYVIEKILEKTLIAAKTAYNAMNAKNTKGVVAEVSQDAISLIAGNSLGKVGKIGTGLQHVAHTVQTASKAVHAVKEGTKDGDVFDGIIGATIVVGGDAFDKTKPGKVIDDVNKYGQKFSEAMHNDEIQPAEVLRQENAENTPTVAAETKPEPAVSEEIVQTEPVAENFNSNMQSGHERLQEARARVAAAREAKSEQNAVALNDAELIRSLRASRPQSAVTVQHRPQAFDAARLMQLQQYQYA